MIEPNGELQLWRVPKVWEGQTIVCVATGPSLTPDQVTQVMESDCRVIVINDAYRLARNANVLYACDARWWIWHDYAPQFLGVRVGLGWDGERGKPYPQWDWENLDGQVRMLASTGHDGLEIGDPRGVRNGGNSGYQAINLAVHLGAKRIVLLGYDMKSNNGKNHWFGDHPGNVPAPPYREFLKAFKTLKDPLGELGVEVLNATPDSALKVFPRVSLQEAV